ncbi:syntaxin-related KNOLLE [Olea europaea subsp. europaea]|uniref:Syntaxin-related KNOLLE n=1 Tax=Olea europaea subsp. europaea TaxID=158383 RepID=A0A8S0TRM9_OLEEU|nr:syntaxin-related KNOLLE [Olea europaea subsp. europaea]
MGVEIQDHYDATKEIEKSLLELHQMFLDMAVMVEAQAASSTPLRFDEKTLDSYNSLHVDATTLSRLSPIESKIGDIQFQMSKFLDFKSGTLAIVLSLKMKLEHKMKLEAWNTKLDTGCSTPAEDEAGTQGWNTGCTVFN